MTEIQAEIVERLERGDWSLMCEEGGVVILCNLTSGHWIEILADGDKNIIRGTDIDADRI